MTAMEGVEEPLSVVARNPDPLVTDITNNFSFDAASGNLSAPIRIGRFG
jgi:hypothetical protein